MLTSRLLGICVMWYKLLTSGDMMLVHRRHSCPDAPGRQTPPLPQMASGGIAEYFRTGITGSEVGRTIVEVMWDPKIPKWPAK